MDAKETSVLTDFVDSWPVPTRPATSPNVSSECFLLHANAAKLTNDMGSRPNRFDEPSGA
jgi:hypothetical protein